ncbi:hypothetical protein RSJ42_04725 [Methanosarcina hadiensis]|uniref:helix-turn-helix transcriptional regulator n=1 Tax=Methanosarcina hadiensis TaxID=3078083 RepID=UPI003977CF4F
MNTKVFILFIAAVAFLAVPVMAENSTATISGGVYSWDTFELLENVVVEVNSTPSQSMVAKYGVYSFNLEPGNYLITASYYQNSTLINSAEKSIEIKGEGNYNVDLLLLPVYSEEFLISENTGNTETSSNITQAASNNSDALSSLGENGSKANVSVAETGKTNGLFTSSILYYFIAAFVLVLLIGGGYNIKSQKNLGKRGERKQEKTTFEKTLSGTYELEKNRLLEEKEGYKEKEYETEKFSMPSSTSGSSAKEPVLKNELDMVESRIKHKLPSKPTETQLPEEPEFQVEKEKPAENKEGQFILNTQPVNLKLKTQPVNLKQETEEKNETFAESPPEKADLEEIFLKEPVEKPEPAKISGPVYSVVKKNLPLPADLQEIMDIIRGQGGRITQKDLRSKLKYSEGKVSLMLADLERRELIEKFKRGRGNVIILRDEQR